MGKTFSTLINRGHEIDIIHIINNNVSSAIATTEDKSFGGNHVKLDELGINYQQITQVIPETSSKPNSFYLILQNGIALFNTNLELIGKVHIKQGFKITSDKYGLLIAIRGQGITRICFNSKRIEYPIPIHLFDHQEKILTISMHSNNHLIITYDNGTFEKIRLSS